ncbi:MSMEG_0569 family flavin-dependent oxidoreductase [Paractinoplanes brasiliensis]|uniref:Putative flavoprotein involved in K+ transport n=1 Tax=Paractinoplanes brasiliensis TaxID=52695 RepID=A0A4R6J935_9ACTN|nr:MSMEG_0569 family flavin-dependent oxidoreductase [Actinoplanes brasiliensis]TDO32124.1 putative flavoprotein involved in K+ transport [Actinoplanes brasiliensis]GID28174.1 FAD-dependent oxidoreductase [Actinoplanes brasiliensis]
MSAHVGVAVIGGGQAGLSMSWYLRQRGADHVVLERDRVGHEWRDRRWDSFCLVTPNWQCRLPGYAYSGDDPDGFMAGAEVVTFLEKYAASFDPPVREGAEVSRLRRTGKAFELVVNGEVLTADQVVIATGGYHRPAIPRVAERLPAHIVQVHSSQYRNPRQLPEGDVLVVGTGQSGCQIAEDLHLSGRRVHLAVGSAPRAARRYRGRDTLAWLDEMGHYDRSVHEFGDADEVRLRANHYMTGRDGGRDIDLRRFATEGMSLYGRLRGVESGTIAFGGDLARNLDHADAVAEGIKDAIDAYIERERIPAPVEKRYEPVWTPGVPRTSLDAGAIGSVVWATGFHRDHRWIEVPVFDGRGFPAHDRGVTSCPGLYFLGLPWQHTWGSGRFAGVARDAEHLCAQITRARLMQVTEGVSWLAGTPTETYPDLEWAA